MPDYPHAEDAYLDPLKRIQTCAVCGEPIIMESGEIMRFGTHEGRIVSLHGDCATSVRQEDTDAEGSRGTTRYG